MNRFYISQELANFLNILRWVSALLVLIGHIRSITFIDLPQINTPTITWKLFYFITGFGHQAVIVFFVLSGFLVGSSILKRYKNRTLSFKKYIIFDRGVRIYIVVIPALILTALLDYFGSKYFNQTDIYTNGLHFASLKYSIVDRLDIKTFIGNLLMLQESFVSTFGSNSPLWSLAYEVWYYIIFFLIVNIFYIDKFLGRVASFLLLILIIFTLNYQITLYFTIWLLGIAVWFVNIKINKIYISFSILLFILLLSLARLHYIGDYEYLSDLLLALSLANMILIIKTTNYNIFDRYKKINTLFSSFSYTLYVIHFPILIFAVSALYKYFNINIQDSPSINRFLYFALLVASIYILSYIFYLFTEKHTKKIQQRLLK